MDDATVWFLSDLDGKISERSGDPLDGHFLFQRISVLIQRLNAILFHETFPAEDGIDTWPFQPAFIFLFLTPGIFTTWGIK